MATTLLAQIQLPFSILAQGKIQMNRLQLLGRDAVGLMRQILIVRSLTRPNRGAIMQVW
jgi:hypothetical protein